MRLKTVLFVRDLASGAERPVWDGLDRDMQEAWAMQGVYPQYAWMPDGRALVIWAQGHIWRVDASSGQPTQIPFRAHVEQTLTDAVRFPQEVHPARIPVRMLRHVVTSPDGSRVVYSALGHLYIKRLPDGEPARVSSGDAIEAFPSFSRDGRSIAYAAWTDKDGGRIRVISPDGGTPRDVVTVPGHYVEPSWSPDGRLIVYRAVTRDIFRGLRWATEPGLFVANADGSGTPRFVQEDGVEPQFDHTGTRIYFRDHRGDKYVLASVRVDGGDEQIHFQSDNATQIVPSPDGRWVAFAERYQPLPGHSRPNWAVCAMSGLLPIATE